MKALSFKQPWASLIIGGDKKIEHRTWQTKYRGPLLICSSSKKAFDIYDNNGELIKLPNGYALGIVSLIDCRPFTKDDQYDACYDMFDFEEEIDLSGFAWVLEDVSPIEPFPVKGKLNFFEVELPELMKNETM